MEYLLDTSVVASLGRASLERARDLAPLVVSPITVYERLSHLEDAPRPGESADDVFRRVRGSVLLCQVPTLLDDPHLEVARNVGAESQVHIGRLMERPIMTRMLDALRASRDLADFYRRQVPIEDNSWRQLDGMARHLSEHLSLLEAEYKSRVTFYNEILKSRLGFDEIRSISGSQYYEIAEAGVQIMAEKFGVEGERMDSDRVRRAIYPHLGYLVVRAVQYAVNAGREGEPHPDKNDVEDSYLACHLATSTPRTLVTGDRGLEGRLAEAFSSFEAATQSRVECAVMSVDAFVRTIGL